ncbi:gluconate 5-dehydrogenase protein [Rutstroemia sp. NJR-2017a BBW]|nr:gluconate 5-dehydrogenase protein [Rutstroemia sp. NJR-2017a BBW]
MADLPLTTSRGASSLPLANKVAIVTGASRGIGAGIAFELGRLGASVAIIYTSATSSKSVDELVQRIQDLNNGARATGVRADLREPSAAQVIVEATLDSFGPGIDILVNNAGVELVKPMQHVTVADFSSVYDLNVRAPLLLTQAVLPYLRAPARIINLGSVGARAGFKNLSVYCSSKAALEGLTRCWAAELGAQGHTVNCVNPGPVQTQLMENIPKETIEMQKASTPIQNRIGTADDIAQVVAWLAGDGSRWVTGQVVSASGGWAMY